MIPFLQAYANNIAETLFWPLVVLGVITAGGLLFSAKLHKHRNWADPVAADSRWYANAAIQLNLIGWIVYAVLGAVPPPDYQVQKVPGPTKYVTSAATYQQAFDACVSSHRRLGKVTGHPPTSQVANICDARASALADPGDTIVTKTVYRDRVKKVKVPGKTRVIYKIDPYSKLFSECRNQYRVSSTAAAEKLDERCHRYATEIRASAGFHDLKPVEKRR